MSFGIYIKGKRLDNNLTLKDVADKLNLSVSYLSDVEKGRRNPFELEKLEKLTEVLNLSEEEKNKLMNLAGKERNEVAPDLTNYIIDHKYVTDALRTVKNLDANEEDWFQFIDEVLQKKEKNGDD